MKRTVAATTLGCKVNLYDTNALLEGFVAAGYDMVDFNDFADVYVINTCSVTNLADKKSRQLAGRAKRRNPQAIIAAVGCSTQANPDKFRNIGVDIIMGTSRRNELLEHVQIFKGEQIISIESQEYNKNYEEMSSGSDTNRTRAFLKVQDGCDNFCAYCVIPHVRGRSRSRSYNDAMTQAHNFADAGYKEIVVAGIHVASYGKDLEGQNLLALLRDIAAIPSIQRVRLSSVEPNMITQKFCDFMAETPKFCNHLHLSLQSGSDDILRSMNRKYTAAEFEKAVEMLRSVSPDIAITTDIIAGFPGETSEHHAETLAFLKEVKFAGLHVFPYSAKAETKAAKMGGQIAKETKTARTKELLALGKMLNTSYAQKFLGHLTDVLIEEVRQDGRYVGKTTNYLSVNFASPIPFAQNDIVKVILEKTRDGVVCGHII